MNYIRQITEDLYANIGKKPILVLYGARQVGKTTLVKDIMRRFKNPLYLQGDDPKESAILQGKSHDELARIVLGHDLVVIDEAQRIKDIGTTLKLIADNIDGVKVIATGSSSFDLANKLSEPLTGRNRTMQLFPLSVKEISVAYGQLDLKKNFESYITYGMYPQIIASPSMEEKKVLVKELASDYLFKDLFLFGNIRNSFAFDKLAKLLALRVGSEISYTELAKEIGISRDTVLTYVSLLERAFIIFRLSSFHTNKTKEINKSQKIYFYDLGMRNALIGNFDPMELRQDKGAVFENFFISEKMKQISYAQGDWRPYFWRKRQTGEVDFLEVKNDSTILAYECKWSGVTKAPESFINSYPQAKFQCVNTENILDVLNQ